MDMRKLVGRNVKRLRQKKGLTQEQFAEVSGFSQQYISSLEQRPAESDGGYALRAGRGAWREPRRAGSAEQEVYKKGQ